jgi:hypothetical protein
MKPAVVARSIEGRVSRRDKFQSARKWVPARLGSACLASAIFRASAVLPAQCRPTIKCQRRVGKRLAPRTSDGRGRRRSRMNALKHGMAAEEVVILGQEDPAELRASHETFIADCKPVGAIEERLVWR